MTLRACSEYRAVAAAENTLDTLVREHAELVRKIAHHLAFRLPDSVDVNDLVQAGMIGLMEAARQYVPGQGASFPTFASIRIRGSMLDEVRRGDWVPRSVHRSMRDLSAAVRRVEQRVGRAAKAAEVAQEMGISLDDYHRILESAARGRVFSLDEKVEESGEPVFAENAPPAEQELERAEFRSELARAIQGLPEREKLLLSLYYEQELNMREIAAVMGVTESRICQLHGQAMARLRARLGDWRFGDAV